MALFRCAAKHLGAFRKCRQHHNNVHLNLHHVGAKRGQAEVETPGGEQRSARNLQLSPQVAPRWKMASNTK